MKGQNYSKKRQAIYSLLCSTKEHPSADWIYNTLKPEYPDLSLGTVYRNVKLLESKGLIKSVTVVNGSERYDAVTVPHSHFICNNCGKILDVYVKLDTVDHVEIRGVKRISSHSLIYYGICEECGSEETVK